MRIAHVICTFPPYKGGMGNSVFHMATQIGRRGHESVVFTPAYTNDTIGEEDLSVNTKVIRLRPLLSFGNAAILPQLIWRLRKFDIVNLHYPFYGSSDFVALAAIFSKTKLVIHYHMDTVAPGLKGLMFRFYSFFILPIILRLASMITCASIDYIKQSQIGDYYLAHRDRFIEIPFGVDTHHFNPGLPKRSPIILFVGGLDRQHYFKGVKQLIEAYAKIASKYSDSRLVLVGSGELEKEYIHYAESKGLVGKFSIDNTASDDKLANWYRLARVMVLPSVNKSEAFGLVLLEAMSSATPVIASNLPGVRNVFRNKEHGYLVTPGDVGMLAEKLECFLSDPAAAEVMGANSRAWIEERYSWERVAERLEAAYLRIFYTLNQKHQHEDLLD